MFKFLKNLWNKLFRPKRHTIFYIEESCSSCGTDTVGYCKNCEEYSSYSHKGLHVTEHGKWKSISNNFKEYSGFNKEIKYRERVYGNPLPTIQKIKTARKISHILYPTPKNGGKYGGIRGHNTRERLRRDILKSIGVDYKPQFQR